MDKNVSIVRVDTRHHRIIAKDNWGLTRDQMRGKHVHHRIPRSKGGTNDPSNLYVCSGWFHKNVWHAEDSYRNLVQYAIEGARKAHSQKDDEGRSLLGLRSAERLNAEKDELGRSVNAVKGAKKLNEVLHKDKDEQGRSSHAMKVHAAKDELGRSLVAMNMLEKTHSVKDDRGKSVVAVKNGKRNGKRIHEEKDESGKSKHGVRSGKAAHKKLNEEGKSIVALELNKIIHAEKDEYGRSVVAMKTNNQRWMDPEHPELGEHSSGTLVRMQMRRGYLHGKENRIKVG
jgi:hypothetical protein